MNAAAALITAVEHYNVDVARWLLQTFPTVDKQLGTAHSLTNDDILCAHSHNPRNIVAMYLEAKHHALFTRHYATETHQQLRLNEAMQLIDEYEQQCDEA